MGLETGTYVDDLVVTNPPGNDSKSQGDDHLRLIKSVLRNTFKRASKSFYLPVQSAKSTAFTIVSTDDNTIFLIDTSGGFIDVTLPTLVSGDAGWSVQFVKTSTDSNTYFLEPASGTINGFSYVRRTVEYIPVRLLWTGSTWVATRQFGAPIGAVMPHFGSTLPNGCLWASGAGFGAGSWKELSAVYPGLVTPDLRGRAVFGRDDMGGGAAGRITNAGSGIVGTTLGASGGEQAHTLTTAELASHNHGVTDPGHTHGLTDPGHSHTNSVNDPGHSHGVSGGTQGGTAAGSVQGGATSAPVTNSAISINSNTTGIGVTVNGNTTGITNNSNTTGISTNNNGSGAAHNNMSPALICNYIVVGE